MLQEVPETTETESEMKTKLKQGQRLRVIIDGNVSIYTTVKQVREGLGDRILLNAAAKTTLEDLERSRAEALKRKEALPIGNLIGPFAGGAIQQIQMSLA